MKPALKRKWLKALRGGEYRQGTDALRRENEYCCLGVLCDINGVRWIRPEPGLSSWRVVRAWYTGLPSPAMMRKYGLSKDVATELAGRNDDGFTFAEIADWIEANL